MKKLLLFLIFLISVSTQAQLSEGFEGGTFPPPSWAVYDNGIGTAQSWGTTTNAALVYAGTTSAFLNRENVPDGTLAEDWLVTPLTVIPTNGQVRFFTRTTQAGNQGSTYTIRVSTTSQTNQASFTTIQTWDETALVAVFDQYEQKVVNLNAYAGQSIYIAFVMSNDNGDRWLVDNVNVDQQCLANTGLTATPTSTSASLSWTSPSSATQWEIEWGPSGFTQGSGTLITPVTTNPYNLTGLTPLTSYSYYVRSLCGTANNSTWTGPFTFTTSAAPPVCGGNFVDSGGASANYANNENITTTICPVTPGDLVTVTFTSFNTELNYDFLRIYDGNSVTAPLLGTYSGTALPPAFTSSAANGCLTFRFTSDGSVNRPGWAANVTCAPAPTCPKPTAVVVSTITATSALVNWTETGTATQWEVLRLPAGSPAPNAGSTGIITSVKPYTLTGLTSQTAYDVYVRSICVPATDISLWSLKATFTTLPNFCAGDIFYDQGGSSANYPNSSDYTITICPDNPGDIVTVTFTSFDTETNWDALYAFDGNSIAAPQIASTNGAGNVPGGLAGGYWGTTIPGPFAATSASGCLTFRFRSDGSVNRPGWAATVTCAPAPTCPKPNALVVSAITSTSASVNWTEVGTATQWEVLRLPAGSPAPNAGSTGVITNVKPYILTGLTSQTAYDVYVRSICVPGSDISLWSQKVTFTTLPDFCAGDIFYDQGGPSANYPNSSDYTITICPNNPGDIVKVTFTSFDTETNWDALYVFDGNSIADPQIASANGAGNVPGGLAGGYWGTTIPGPFEASSASGCLTFRFRSDGSVNRPGWAATVTCLPPPTCIKPINLAVSNITQTSASLSWTEAASATNWEVLVVPFGSPIPTASTLGIATTTNPYLATGLNPGVRYTFYVRAICSGADKSDWTALNFSTKPVNDECSAAINVPVNQNLSCVQTISGSITGATGSSQPNGCAGSADDDIWYKFTASANSHTISFSNVTPNTGLAFGIYTGTNCTSLTQVLCVNAANGVANSLTIGQEYYIRVYSTSAVPQTSSFVLCIGTVPCTEAVPFCSGQVLTFPNSTNVVNLGSLGCLGSSPNSSFFFLQVTQSGQLNYLMTQSTTPGGPANLDVDYALWGPFTSNSGACQVIPNNNPLQCSYSAAPTENFSINAQVCEIYVLMITNFANQPGYITLSQTNASTGGQTACYPYNTFNYSAFEYCQDAPNQLPVLVAGAQAGTYSASPNGLVIDTVTGEINIAASVPGVYTVTSTTIPTTGGVCPGIDNIITTRTVKITESPNATISYDAAVYCNSDNSQHPVTVTGTQTGTFSASPSGLFIDSINGTITAGISQPGVYTVTYGIPALGGCSAFNTTTQVEILAAPQIPFQADVAACNTYTLQPLTVGNYYTGPNATGTMLTAGTAITSSQVVYVYATNSFCSSEDSFQITINSVPQPTINYLTQPTCANQTGSIEVTNPVLVAGTVPSNLFISEITDEDSGSLTYVELYNGTNATIDLSNYKLKVYNNGNAIASCSQLLSGTIASNATFIIKLSNSPDAPGITPNLTFSGSGCDGVNNDDSIVLTTSTDAVIDVWGVNGTIFTPANQPGYTYRRLANATPLPSATWNASDWNALDPQDYSDVGNYTLFVANYEYSVDGGPYQSSTVFTSLTPGTHVLIVHDLITDCYSAPYSFTINAVPYTEPVTTFSYNLPICINGTNNPTPNTSATNFVTGGTYTSNSTNLDIDATTGEIFLNNSFPGVYLVTYSVAADTPNCVNAGQSTFEVTISDITSSVIIDGCIATNFVVTANPANDTYDPSTVTYQWYNSLNNLIGTTRSVTVTSSGNYTVIITSADGCDETITFSLNDVNCTIPKGISPNGDGFNDSFDLSRFNVKSLMIFNRYGKEVYSNGDYSNQWRGQSSNGKDLPDGTYYYSMTLDDGNALTGWIYINR